MNGDTGSSAPSSELPKQYLGVYVKAGYLVEDLNVIDQGNGYIRMARAAEEGDETARLIMDTLPVTHSELYLYQQLLGVNVIGFASKHCQISPAQYPPRYTGSSWDHLQHLASQGSYLASRLIACVTRHRFVNPDFQFRDTRK